MKISRTHNINIQEDEETIVTIDIDKRLEEFYKKETGHKRVTNRGLSKFYNNLVKLFTR